ncbi:MAG: hypothetical protein AAGB05_07900 [Pseudomonadota bacterium]
MSFGQAISDAGARDGRFAVSAEARLALGLVGVWALMSVLTLAPGALVLTRHEGDAMHLAAMVLRMAEGQWPHVDFMTPIGALALAPIAGLVALGLGLGQAIIWSQILFAAALLPVIWWVAMSRFGSGWIGMIYGALVLVMVMAMVHGGTTQAVSVSMHYNRWAWALAFVIVPLVLVPSQRAYAPWREGTILGAAFVALALIKVTYVPALLPAVLLALSLRRAYGTMAWGVGCGLALCAGITMWGGLAFWQGYVADLFAVAQSETRQQPGGTLSQNLVAPTHLAGTLAGLAAVILLRKAGRPVEGIVMLALLPGFIVIAWQNYGNDAQWLPVVALALLVLRPERDRTAFVVTAAVALALSSGWMANMATSGLRMFGTDVSESGVFFPGAPAHADFRLDQTRLDKVVVATPYAPLAAPTDGPDWGLEIDECTLRSGGMRVFHAVADELAEAGYTGRPMLVADTFQSFWLFGDFPALPGGAPWYYGGLPGAAVAEIIAVPLCPTNPDVRTILMQAVTDAGWTYSEVYRGTHVAVLELGRP